MRILPVFSRSNKSLSQIRRTGFEKNTNIPCARLHHKYTGIASVDLAYASMFDESIANDLRLMKLI